MAGRKTLRSIRLAREATNGTRVTPRYLWRGNGDWVVDEREVTKVEELVGISGGTDRTYIAKLAASVEIAETEATYKQLPALFYGMGLTPRTGYNTFGTRVPAMNTGASGSVWRYGLNIPSTVFPTNYSYTVESGDNVEAQVAVYAVTEEVSLTFEAGEAAKVSANMLAQYGTRTNAEGSFSAVGTLENVTVMLSSKTKAFDITPTTITLPNFGIQGTTARRYWLLSGNKVLLRDAVEYTTVYTADATLRAIYVLDENNVWVVGNNGTILFWNGSAWTQLSYWPLSDNAAAGNLLKAELTFKALWAPKYWLDGGILYPGTMVLTGHEITGKLTFEHQNGGTISAAGTSGQIEKWRNQQAQVLSLFWQDSDSVGSEVGFGLVLPFKWDTLQEYDDMDGNNIVSGEFTSKYNETFAGRGYMFFETGFDYSNIVGTV